MVCDNISPGRSWRETFPLPLAVVVEASLRSSVRSTPDVSARVLDPDFQYSLTRWCPYPLPFSIDLASLFSSLRLRPLVHIIPFPLKFPILLYDLPHRSGSAWSSCLPLLRLIYSSSAFYTLQKLRTSIQHLPNAFMISCV